MADGAEARSGTAEAAGGEDAGDRAFDALFRREHARVTAIARRVLGDPDEAADVAQEVFLQAFRARAEGRVQPEAWLSAAAVHTALNYARGRRRRLARDDRDARQRAALTALGGPEAAYETAEERRRVRRVLARLPGRQAAVLVLRHSGLSYAEVATALGLRPTSVGTVLRRAEAAMRKEWERHASE